MKLIDVYDEPNAEDLLYRLMAERPLESCVSHVELPNRQQHARFVESHPFRYWYLIRVDSHYVGAIECTDRNEVGVSLLCEYRRKHYATEALELFLMTHKPLPPIPAVRNANWLANIAANNHSSKRFFESLGFKKIQETWICG